MRKSTLFISAVLTTFVLATLAGVVSAYQNVVNSAQVEALVQPQPVQNVAQQMATSATPEIVNLTPEEAAALASKVLGQDDLFSVEVTDLDGESVYLVTFSAGDLVYVSLDGQIRSIGKIEPTIVTVASKSNKKDTGEKAASRNNDDHDNDHEDDDHDDD